MMPCGGLVKAGSTRKPNKSISAHGFRRGHCSFIPSAGSLERPRRNRPWDSEEHRPAGPQNEGADRWTFLRCPQRRSASPPLQDRPRSHPPCCTRRTVWRVHRRGRSSGNSRVPCQSRSPLPYRLPPPVPGFPVRPECRSHCGRFSPVRRDSIWPKGLLRLMVLLPSTGH